MDTLERLYQPNGTILADGEAGVIEAISHEFAIRLSMEIGDENLREVVRLNATPEYAPTCCASHNFCDANMVMLDAMRAWGHDLFTPEGDISEDETRISDAAWDQAKEYRFDL